MRFWCVLHCIISASLLRNHAKLVRCRFYSKVDEKKVTCTWTKRDWQGEKGNSDLLGRIKQFCGLLVVLIRPLDVVEEAHRSASPAYAAGSALIVKPSRKRGRSSYPELSWTLTWGAWKRLPRTTEPRTNAIITSLSLKDLRGFTVRLLEQSLWLFINYHWNITDAKTEFDSHCFPGWLPICDTQQHGRYARSFANDSWNSQKEIQQLQKAGIQT
jgi:hypothetical protein